MSCARCRHEASTRPLLRPPPRARLEALHRRTLHAFADLDDAVAFAPGTGRDAFSAPSVRHALRTFHDAAADEANHLQGLLDRFRYGCFCGPGSGCATPRDAMDACCRRHDAEYQALGVSFLTMGTPSALRRTVQSDCNLVSCVQRARVSGPAAVAARATIVALFGGRCRIGRLLAAAARIPSPSIPGVGPLWFDALVDG